MGCRGDAGRGVGKLKYKCNKTIASDSEGHGSHGTKEMTVSGTIMFMGERLGSSVAALSIDIQLTWAALFSARAWLRRLTPTRTRTRIRSKGMTGITAKSLVGLVARRMALPSAPHTWINVAAPYTPRPAQAEATMKRPHRMGVTVFTAVSMWSPTRSKIARLGSSMV